MNKKYLAYVLTCNVEFDILGMKKLKRPTKISQGHSSHKKSVAR